MNFSPPRLEYDSGTDQAGIVGRPLKPFIVRCISKESGQVGAGLKADWRLAQGSGHFTEIKDECTGTDGFANAEFVPDAHGPYRVECTVEGMTLSFIGQVVPADAPDDIVDRPDEEPVRFDGPEAPPEGAGPRPPPLPDPEDEFWSKKTPDVPAPPKRPDERRIKTQKIERPLRFKLKRWWSRKSPFGAGEKEMVKAVIMLVAICAVALGASLVLATRGPKIAKAAVPAVETAAMSASHAKPEPPPMAARPEIPAQPPAAIDCRGAAWRIEGRCVIYSCRY